MPVSSISATFSHRSQCAPIEKFATSFSMLSPASGLLPAWHSKQNFWNDGGGTDEGRGAWAATGRGIEALTARTGRVAGAWADRIDASANTEAAHNTGRVMELQDRGP